jgi:hypothetical protein
MRLPGVKLVAHAEEVFSTYEEAALDSRTYGEATQESS